MLNCTGCGNPILIGVVYYHFPTLGENYHFECVPQDDLKYRFIKCEKRNGEE
jgi:hypothetical protein